MRGRKKGGKEGGSRMSASRIIQLRQQRSFPDGSPIPNLVVLITPRMVLKHGFVYSIHMARIVPEQSSAVNWPPF